MKKYVKLLLILTIAVSMCGCGKEKGSKLKDYEGYYVSANVKSNTYIYMAMRIGKKGETVYSVNKDQYRGITEGTINVEGNKGYFYNTNYTGEPYVDWTKNFPLIFTLINDGNGLYVEASESDGWSPDSYNRVTKKEYEAFCEEHKVFKSGEDYEKYKEELIKSIQSN